MNTLASILAGQGGNPYQTTQGISPLLSQFLLSQQLAQGQLGQGQQAQPQVPQQPQIPSQQASGLGSMGTAAGINPQLLQMAVAQNQGGTM